jgi:hypothetical protein
VSQTPVNMQQVITDAAALPLSAEQDGERATQHNLKDLIAVQEHLNNKAAANRGARGIRRSQVRFGDAIGRLPSQ